MRETSLETQS